MTTLHERIRGAAALVGLVGLLAGIPTALIAVTGAVDWPHLAWPVLDDSLTPPSVQEQLAVWLDRSWHTLRLDLRVDDTIVLLCLAAGWGVWAVLACWTLRDLAAALRSGPAHLRTRMATTPRGWITALVTTAVLLGSTSPAFAYPSTSDPVAAGAPRQPGGPQRTPDAAQAAASLTTGGHADPHPPVVSIPGPVRYHVQRGDTLWALARDHLDNPHRWTDIATLNPHLPHTGLLRSGDTLLLPTDATVPAPARIPAESRWVTVHTDDTLACIAQRELGDSARWEEIFLLNSGRRQPDGRALRDADVVFPGWHLALPPRNSSRDTHTTPPVPTEPIPVPTQTNPPTTPAPPPTPRPVPDGKTRPPAQTAPTRAVGVDLTSGVFLGMGVAAAVSAALVLARARHRRHHRPGTPAEPDLAVAPTVLQLHLVHQRATDTSTPGNGNGKSRVIDEDNEYEAPAVVPDEASVPMVSWSEIPVPIGTRNGREVELDLAATGGLGLTGSGADSVARALLVAAHTHPDALRLVLSHDAAKTLLPDLDIQHTSLVVLDDLTKARPAATTTELPSAAPLTLVLAHAPEAHSEDSRLVHELSAEPGVAVILLGAWPQGTAVPIHADGTLAPEHTLGTAWQDLRMFTANPTAVAEVLTLNDSPPTPPTPDSPAAITADPTHLESTGLVTEPRPASAQAAAGSPSLSVQASGLVETEPNSGPQSEHAGCSLRVLGPPTLIWTPPEGQAQDITSALTARQQELLVYLALHPQGVPRDTLITDLWHHQPPSRPTNALNTTLSRLRAALSDTTAGTLIDLLDTRNAHMRLDPELVHTDYHVFTNAEHTSRTTTDPDTRRAALHRLVHTYDGELGAGLSAEWIDTPRYTAQRSLVNAVGALARDLIDTDPRKVLALLEIAREADPYNEHLYRDIMRLQDRLGAHYAIPTTLHLLNTRLGELDLTPAPETRALAESLQQRHSPSHS